MTNSPLLLAGPSGHPEDSCPQMMVCEEEPLSKAQVSKFKNELSTFREQMQQLVQMVQNGSTPINFSEGVVFRTTETSLSKPVAAPRSSSFVPPVSKERNSQAKKVAPRQQTVNLKPVGSSSQRVIPSNRISSYPKQSSSQSSPSPATLIDLTRPTSLRLVANGAAEQQLREWPCLAVQARTQKSPAPMASKKEDLDSLVKSLLILPAESFTKRLMQQGLVLTEQSLKEAPHVNLKLAIYTDAKKFPQSGGYVWMMEGGGKKFVSVFRGSIFEHARLTPVNVLKLIYHWACQTSIHNVVQWVKIEISAINRFYEMFRAICTASVQEEMCNLGGNSRTVEIGIVTLATAAPGSKKQKNWEILGIYDRMTSKIRLRTIATDAASSIHDRVAILLSVLPVWVQKASRLIVDPAVEPNCLRRMGYKNVIISGSGSGRDGTCQQIMEYLKVVVPTMFQTNLGQLSGTSIQGLLDELTFREKFGYYPLAAFNALTERIAFQSKAAYKLKTSMLERCQKIAADPSKDWRITRRFDPTSSPSKPTEFFDSTAPASAYVPKLPQKRAASNVTSAAKPAMPAKKLKQAVMEHVNLESYYYATLPGDMQTLSNEFKGDMVFKCHLCDKSSMSNIAFMKHMSLHISQSSNDVVVPQHQCKYCFKEFSEVSKMEAHIVSVHFHKEANFQCKICSEKLVTKYDYVLHMSTRHVAAEMPYHCMLCGFRSSIHGKVIEHFEKCHGQTDKVQCPKCLEIFLLSDNQEAGAQYALHLKEHFQSKDVACKKCTLVFHTDKDMKDHNHKDHMSYKGFQDLQAYQYSNTEQPISMAKPDERMVRLAEKQALGAIKPSVQNHREAAQASAKQEKKDQPQRLMPEVRNQVAAADQAQETTGDKPSQERAAPEGEMNQQEDCAPTPKEDNPIRTEENEPLVVSVE